MKYKKADLKRMALEVLEAGQRGDVRYMEFMFTLAAYCFGGNYGMAEQYTRSLAS